MIVYVVRKITDHEYGCRNIEGVFSTKELAQKYINSTNDQFEYEFWNDIKEMNYIIKEYVLQEDKVL